MRKKIAKNPGWLLVIILAAAFSYPRPMAGQSADQVGKLFEKISWRSVGPSQMGGRTVDIDAVERAPWIIYAAIGPSGVWKSENNGVTWTPVFHKEATVSVGDVTIARSHPDIVWVGTGEATSRNSVTIGGGVYKSTDAGKTWTNLGLKDTRHISRIVINPGDPNIVYVAAMGHLWGPNTERGVFKTADGGKTWTKVLYVNENTGIADLAMDPSDSLILYAAAYEHRRLPYLFTSGGPGSGLYKTTDGGQTWRRLIKDLPDGLLGRIGVGVSRSSPNVVYALVEHKDGGIWRSEDKGESWKRMCAYDRFKQVNTRPFYYSHIFVDPTDDKVIYVLSTGAHVSRDMGQNFKPIGQGIHPDHHALWINPSNPLHLIEGNDGGIDISYDGGKTWLPVQSMDLAEVYQVGFDMRKPYYVYCGLQDNGSWGGPSATTDTSGITNDDWFVVGGGDGFYVQPDPDDPNTVYSNWQVNNVYRLDLRIRRSKMIKPIVSLKEPAYRFNWNSPIHISPHDSKTIYVGGQFLFKSTDRGNSWAVISPDLTTNDPAKQKDSGGPITPDNSGAESHCTITTISESPAAAGVIWCGTDDGNLQLTRDGGKTWTNVVKAIPGLPKNTWCSHVEASRFEAGTAYASFDGHQHDDYGTYVYRTSDFGKTWKSIKSNLPFGWVHVIREDPKNKNLLYVGTEFSIFASLDRGETWFSLKNDLPTAAVHDIAVHPRENDLIIGTHGRGIWILDDIPFLQGMTPEALNSSVHLFDVRPATAYFMSSRREAYSKPTFAAKNPLYGLTFNAYIKTKPKEKPKMKILDAAAEVIFEMELALREGIHRETWNLQFVPRTKDGRRITAGVTGVAMLPVVAPGDYTVELHVDGQKTQKKAVVEADPRVAFDGVERSKQQEALVEVLDLSRRQGLAITAAGNIRRQLDAIREELKKTENAPEPAQAALTAFNAGYLKLEDELIPKLFIGTSQSRESLLRGGALTQQIMSLGQSINNYPAAPSQTDLSRLKELQEQVNALVERLNKVIKEDIPVLNKILGDNKVKTIQPPQEVK